MVAITTRKAGHGVFRLGLGKKPLGFGYFENIGETGVVARTRLRVAVTSGLQLLRRIRGNFVGRRDDRARASFLCLQREQRAIVAGRRLAESFGLDAASCLRAKDFKRGECHRHADCPVGNVQGKPASPRAAIDLPIDAAARECRLQLEPRKIRAIEDAFLGADRIDLRIRRSGSGVRRRSEGRPSGWTRGRLQEWTWRKDNARARNSQCFGQGQSGQFRVSSCFCEPVPCGSQFGFRPRLFGACAKLILDQRAH
jgi:hypothetical protein